MKCSKHGRVRMPTATYCAVYHLNFAANRNCSSSISSIFSPLADTASQGINTLVSLLAVPKYSFPSFTLSTRPRIATFFPVGGLRDCPQSPQETAFLSVAVSNHLDRSLLLRRTGVQSRLSRADQSAPRRACLPLNSRLAERFLYVESSSSFLFVLTYRLSRC